MASAVEHPGYLALEGRLAAGGKGTLGPLQAVCRHILRGRLAVNRDLLGLDALSLNGHSNRGQKGYEEISQWDEEGLIKKGKFNAEDDEIILTNFKSLVAEANVDREAFRAELFAENKGNNGDREFMLKRQLVGFSLLQGLAGGARRLPLQAYSRLGVLLTGGTFTRAEDAAILAWVEERGATGWAELARSLGRTYLKASDSVIGRYKVLMDERAGKRKATVNSGTRDFSLREEEVILREVMEQNPRALEEMLPGDTIDWAGIARRLNRPKKAVYGKYMRSLHPTLRRHLAGRLEEDVRPALVRRVKERGWVFGADIDYGLVAGIQGFEGHTGESLCLLYHSMMGQVKRKLELDSSRDVRVEQVEEWLERKVSRGKTERKREWEQEVVGIHRRLEGELRREE
jgi:hypothetical protein